MTPSDEPPPNLEEALAGFSSQEWFSAPAPARPRSDEEHDAMLLEGRRRHAQQRMALIERLEQNLADSEKDLASALWRLRVYFWICLGLVGLLSCVLFMQWMKGSP